MLLKNGIFPEVLEFTADIRYIYVKTRLICGPILSQKCLELE
jgi:hypothetical protein